MRSLEGDPWGRTSPRSTRLPYPVAVLVLLLLGTARGGLVPAAAAEPYSPRTDTTQAWAYTLTSGLSFSQAAFKDWKDSQSNTMSFTTSLAGTAQREKGRWTQTHDVRGAIGLLWRADDDEDDPFRKPEDRIRIQSDLRYKGRFLFRLLRPTLSGNLRTQFAKGFNFSKNPFPNEHPEGGREPPVQTSEFLGPAYVTETLGLTFASQDWFTVRLGVATKQTIVRDKHLRALYGLDRSSAVRAEGGTELSGTLERKVGENLTYSARLNAFHSLEEGRQWPDMVWENYLSMQVNSWLSTDLEFVATYDEDTSSALQLKERLSVGVKLSTD
jgi:hypothetical protein